MEPIAPVASATASRLMGLSINTLTEGQLVQARVARVDGNQVRLQFGEQSLNASSRVPLTVGQQMSLLVEQGASGKMLLRMVDDTFGKGRPARGTGSDPGGTGSQSGGASAVAGGRQGPVTPVPGRNGREPSGGQQQSAGQGSPGNPGTGMVAHPTAGRPTIGVPPQGRPAGATSPAPPEPGRWLWCARRLRTGRHRHRPDGWRQTGRAGPQVSSPWTPGALGLPSMAASATALANLLFAPLDGTPARPAGSHDSSSASSARAERFHSHHEHRCADHAPRQPPHAPARTRRLMARPA